MRKAAAVLLGTILGISFLTGCGSQSFDNIPLQAITPDQSVSAQSTKGLNAYVEFNISQLFNFVDADKDGYVNFQEFYPLYQVPSVPANPAPASDAEAKIIRSTADQPQLDGKARFAKIDRNRDGKISKTEAKNNLKYFMSMDKKQFRESAKSAFSQYNTDKNNVVSKAEYDVYLQGAPYELRVQLSGLFFTSDKNKNGALTFSEYEDLFYAQSQAYMSEPMDPMPLPPADPDPNQPPSNGGTNVNDGTQVPVEPPDNIEPLPVAPQPVQQ
jgi:Ca2+-binding EF-hand superfamily protein